MHSLSVVILAFNPPPCCHMCNEELAEMYGIWVRNSFTLNRNDLQSVWVSYFFYSVFEKLEGKAKQGLRTSLTPFAAASRILKLPTLHRFIQSHSAAADASQYRSVIGEIVYVMKTDRRVLVKIASHKSWKCSYSLYHCFPFSYTKQRQREGRQENKEGGVEQNGPLISSST